MDLSVIIPNYNGEKLLIPLISRLEELLAKSGLNYEIILADDCSNDESVTLVKSTFPWVRVEAGGERKGFGGNCNRGAKASNGNYLAFVNTDIEFEGDIFNQLIKSLSDSRVFAVMPLIFAERLGRVENYTFLWKHRGLVWLKPRGEIELTSAEEVAKKLEPNPIGGVPLCGAFFICKKDIFNTLGGFDEIFSPAYWEDVDLGFRAEELGYDILLVPGVKVLHKHSITIDISFGGSLKKRLLLRNQALFIKKHLNRLAPIPNFRIWLSLRIFQRLFQGYQELIPIYLSIILSRQ